MPSAGPAHHLTLAVTRTVWVAAAVLIVFSVHSAVWGITVASLRQRLVPAHLLGRVGSTYVLLDQGGAALGSLAGGLLAGAWAITTPFWIAAAAMAAITALAWRPLRQAAPGGSAQKVGSRADCGGRDGD